MARRTPPLNQLRAFEAAARHSSFRRAADELNVTHAAISHHVKALEEYFSVPLFDRMPRSVRLTNAAAAYYPVLRDALDSIEDGAVCLMAEKSTRVLKISVAPSFATRWLHPRIARFNAANPDITVEIDVAIELAELGHSDIDLAIRHGSGEWDGLVAHRLMTEEILPVCAPNLLENVNQPTAPRDLLSFTLLGAKARKSEWPAWFEAAGLKGTNLPHMQLYPTQALALDAAVAGLGIAITDRILVTKDIKNGRLKLPIDLSIRSSHGYHLVYPESIENDSKVRVFHDWLKDELAN